MQHEEGAMTLKGKRPIITGSNSGIGLGVAEELAKRRRRCRASTALPTAPKITRWPPNRRRPRRERALHPGRHVEGRRLPRPDRGRGGCDILVNNAGIQHVAPIEEFPVEKWDAILAINLSSAFHTTAAALPGCAPRGWGRIVNIASAHGLTASPFKSAYIAAKHGIVGLSKTVALETAGQGITCNAICPGYVLTPLVEAQIPDQMKVHGMDRETVIREVMLLRQPSRQFATTEQIGGTVVYLCSPYADQVTGTTISVDGGWTALFAG
jgi:3-hydroxybutyrate dehydrogenase